MPPLDGLPCIVPCSQRLIGAILVQHTIIQPMLQPPNNIGMVHIVGSIYSWSLLATIQFHHKNLLSGSIVGNDCCNKYLPRLHEQMIDFRTLTRDWPRKGTGKHTAVKAAFQKETWCEGKFFTAVLESLAEIQRATFSATEGFAISSVFFSLDSQLLSTHATTQDIFENHKTAGLCGLISEWFKSS